MRDCIRGKLERLGLGRRGRCVGHRSQGPSHLDSRERARAVYCDAYRKLGAWRILLGCGVRLEREGHRLVLGGRILRVKPNRQAWGSLYGDPKLCRVRRRAERVGQVAQGGHRILTRDRVGEGGERPQQSRVTQIDSQWRDSLRRGDQSCLARVQDFERYCLRDLLSVRSVNEPDGEHHRLSPY